MRWLGSQGVVLGYHISPRRGEIAKLSLTKINHKYARITRCPDRVKCPSGATGDSPGCQPREHGTPILKCPKWASYHRPNCSPWSIVIVLPLWYQRQLHQLYPPGYSRLSLPAAGPTVLHQSGSRSEWISSLRKG